MRQTLRMADGIWVAGDEMELGYEESLHQASLTGDMAQLQRILGEEGADINELDASGLTPLYLAVSAGQLAAARFLLVNHANPYTTGSNGSAPVHGAARHGHTSCVELLLGRKADVNVRGVHGRTPLILAARNGHVDTVRTLLDHGADPHQADDGSRSAVDDASNLHIIHLLRRHVERAATHNGRYEVERSSELGSCRGVCEGVRAIDMATGERVAILRFSDLEACQRARSAELALHGTFSGGFGTISGVPSPWAPSDAAEEAVEPEPAVLGGSGETTANEALDDGGSDSVPEPQPVGTSVLVVPAWSMTLREYARTKRNVLPHAELRAVLSAVLQALAALHAASLAHGAVGTTTVARFWDGTWRLVELHHTRHQGMKADPDVIAAFTKETDAQVAEKDGKPRAIGANLPRARQGAADGAFVVPSYPPEGIRRATAAADVWAVGVLALGLLTRTGQKQSLPCGRAAGPDRYWAAVETWMKAGDALQPQHEELLESLLCFDPGARIEAAEALTLPFFTDNLMKGEILL